MSGIEKIKEKILRDAKEKSASILQDANDKVVDRNRQEEIKNQREFELLDEKAKTEGDSLYKRLISMEELRLRQDELALKQNLIQEAFQLATQKLQKLTEAEYTAFMSGMLVRSVTSGKEEIVLADTYKEAMAKTIEKLNKEKSWNLTLSTEKREITDGFILMDGDIEINNSFSAILHANQEEWTQKVAQVLFEA